MTGEYPLLELLPLAAFALGALSFSALTAFYWSERRRKRSGTRSVFPLFTLVCAAAFVSNLLLQATLPTGLAGSTVALMRNLATALIPPIILHLVFEAESPALPRPRVWRSILAVIYTGGVVAALLRIPSDFGVLLPWGEMLVYAPAATLAASTAVALLLQALSRRPLTASQRAHRRWIRALLLLLLVCAAASLAGFGAFVSVAPDYLLLAFFGVSLYYRERLVFFDLLVKRGAFLAVGLMILAAGFALRGSVSWFPWASALGLLFYWLAAPWVYSRVAYAIDRIWLRRPYSPAEAERQFIRDIQAAATEEELQTRSATSLHAIFQAPAVVRFDSASATASDDALAVDLEGNGTPAGSIRLDARPNGIPFLSDDRRLLQSLAGALAVVLENVRFRVERRIQDEREQRLLWLASRAELKALRAQINPHFLFNALSAIAGLMHYRPELADETIEQLAQVFRYALRKSETEWAPLSEEVDFVSAYLHIEQARFGERLRIEFDVAPGAGPMTIPAMSIQPLIENAIKHGVTAVDGCGTVGLRASLDDGLLTVEVSDNGPGFPPGFALEDGGESHGLRNVKERLRGYYGEAARLSWESGNGGTRVMLTLPAEEHAGDTRSDRRR